MDQGRRARQGRVPVGVDGKYGRCAGAAAGDDVTHAQPAGYHMAIGIVFCGLRVYACVCVRAQGLHGLWLSELLRPA